MAATDGQAKPLQPREGASTDGGDTGVELRLQFFPLLFFLSFVKPVVKIDGKPHALSWGEHFLPLAPGGHRIEAYFPYLFLRRCGAASVDVVLAEGSVAQVEYSAPLLLLLAGSIRLLNAQPDDEPSLSEDQQTPAGPICWFCGQNPADPMSVTDVELRAHDGQQHRRVDVPRCSVCAGVHERGVLGAGCGCLIGGFLCIAAAGALGELTGTAVLLMAAWCLVATGAGFWAEARPIVRHVCYAGLSGIVAGFVAGTVVAGMSAGLGTVVGLIVFAGVAAVAFRWRHDERLTEDRELVAARAAVTTKPFDAREKFSEVQKLLEQNWQIETEAGEAGPRFPWQKRVQSPDELYAQNRPKRCPICGKSVSPTWHMYVTEWPFHAVRCSVCGAWGCTNCCHHHHDGQHATTYTSEATSQENIVRVYKNIAWQHDEPCCANCSSEYVAIGRDQGLRPKHTVPQESE